MFGNKKKSAAAADKSSAAVKRTAWKAVVWARLRQVEADVKKSACAACPRQGRPPAQTTAAADPASQTAAAPNDDAMARCACAIPENIQQYIKAADTCLNTSIARKCLHLDFLTGNLLMSAYTYLHAAERARVLLLSDEQVMASLPSIRARATVYLKADNQHRVALDGLPDTTASAHQASAGVQQQSSGQSRSSGQPTIQEIAEAALGAAFEAEDQQQAQVRRFRSVLFGTFIALLVLVAILAFVGLRDPGLISLCVRQHDKAIVCPSGGSEKSRANMGLVLGFGSIGASLAVARHLTALKPGVRYSLSVAEGLLKVALGAVIAVLGILLLRTQVEFVGILASQAGLLTAAVVFGYGQQLFTGLIDRRATIVMDAASPLTPRSMAHTP
jgi:hypothetical protein